MKNFKLGLLMLFCLGGRGSQAEDSSDGCEGRTQPYVAVLSGEMHPEKQALVEELHRLHKWGGVYDRLGVLPERGLHVLSFLSGSQIACISAVAGCPTPTWMDGAQIYRAMNQVFSGPYEFVVNAQGLAEKGEKGHTSYSYYRIDVPNLEQVDVITHVTPGHNFFAQHSPAESGRATDPVKARLRLGTAIKDSEKVLGARGVEQIVHFLQAVAGGQDYFSLSYHSPDAIERQMRHQGEKRDGQNLNIDAPLPVGGRTSNVLQAVLARMRGNSVHPLKQRLATEFEAGARIYPSVSQSIYINEGTATIVMYLLHQLKAPEHRDLEGAIRSGRFIAPVRHKSFDNYYYFGTEMWIGLARDFFARPDLQNLSYEDQLKEFFVYAKAIISDRNTITDAQFVMKHLKDSWIQQKNLALIKKLSQDEYFQAERDGTLEQAPRGMQQPWPFRVQTHDPKRLRVQIARRFTDPRSAQPQMEVDLHHSKPGLMVMESVNRYGQIFPVTLSSAVLSLFEMVKLTESAVQADVNILYRGDEGVARSRWEFSSPADSVIYRCRLTLGVDGQVAVEIISHVGTITTEQSEDRPWWDNSGEEVFVPGVELTKDPNVAYREEVLRTRGQKIIESYVEDLTLDVIKPVKNMGTAVQIDAKPLYGSAAQLTYVGDRATSPQATAVGEFLDTGAEALFRFQQKVQGRMRAAIQRGLTGGGGVTRGKKKVKVRALPRNFWFAFDGGAKERLTKILSTDKNLENNPIHPDDAHLIRPTAARDGSIIWVDLAKLPPGQSNESGEDGTGEGNGEGRGDTVEEGEGSPGQGEGGEGEVDQQPGEGEEPGDGNGGGGGDPGVIEIDLDTYAKHLAGEVVLPRLRPLQVSSARSQDVPAGFMKAPVGSLLTMRTAREVLKNGLAVQMAEGGSLDGIDLNDVFDRGLSVTPPSQFYRKSTSTRPLPDINAQVTIVADLSGSMMFNIPAMKQMIFDLEMLLKRKYPKVKFKYVAFDGNAHAFDDPEEFYRAQLGGGTSYAVGFKKVAEVQEEFPEAKWDRYVVNFGDMEDAKNAELEKQFDLVRKQSRFVGVVAFKDPHMGDWMGEGFGLFNYFGDHAKTDDFVGYVEVPGAVDPTTLNMVQIYRTVFKNDKK